jgi:hypothetical protein
MHSRRRDQDGLALLTNAGSLLGDYAQRLCALRTAKRYPASFGGRQGSHSALRDKPVLVVHGLPRACGRSQGCRANRHSLAGAFASHYPKQTALARSRLYRLFEWSAGVTYDIPRQRSLKRLLLSQIQPMIDRSKRLLSTLTLATRPGSANPSRIH